MSFTAAELRILAIADELEVFAPSIAFDGDRPGDDVVAAVLDAQRMGLASVWCRGLWVRHHSGNAWRWHDETERVAS